jgi:hypothetical protein
MRERTEEGKVKGAIKCSVGTVEYLGGWPLQIDHFLLLKLVISSLRDMPDLTISTVSAVSLSLFQLKTSLPLITRPIVSHQNIGHTTNGVELSP